MSSFLPTIKRRRYPLTPPHRLQMRTNGNTAWAYRPDVVGFMDEEIISQCHTGIWPPPLDSDRDIGGPMSLHRTWREYTPATINAYLSKGQVTMGGLFAYTTGVSPASAGSALDINLFGTSAIAKVLPTNPNSSLSTALGELKKDGLPTLPGQSFRDRADRARSAGNEYLNIEFGWLPLVRDLQDFAQTVRNARVLIDQYKRDSDRKIRRRFDPQPTHRKVTAPTSGGQLSNFQFTDSCTITREEEIKYWFSGAFKYHVPVGDDVYSRLRRYESFASRLFDTRLTPELLWNLAPWSWAVDWFTNAGDVIHNISRLGSDGLVMQYGYAMRRSIVREEVKAVSQWSDPYGSHTAKVSTVIGSEWKQRVRAHPYGFGITDTSLSARQLAILAALGLTRGQREP